MDRRIERKWYGRRRVWWGAGSALVVVLLLFLVLVSGSHSQLQVESKRLDISTIQRGPFQEYIATTGNVLPIRTVFLDAMDGGRVERVVRDAGSFVTKGDTLLLLSNTSLVLDIMNREAQLFEQRNNLRNTRLAMQQNALKLEADLLDLRRRIQVAKRLYERNRQLFEEELISKDAFDDAKEEYEYLTSRRDLTIRMARQDSTFRNHQIEMLEESVGRIQGNLKVVRQNLDNLCLRAPVSGHLTSLNAEVGESKSPGERIGQIDILDGFKVRSEIDEYYVTRLSIGLAGQFELDNQTFRLRVAKVYPEVRDGRFPVDMQFVGRAPGDIRRGQTLHIRLELGDPVECVLLPRGGFYASTGGRWVYVLDESGSSAARRRIRIGRQNPKTFEVLEGLEPGERVVISTYDGFGDADKLIFRN